MHHKCLLSVVRCHQVAGSDKGIQSQLLPRQCEAPTAAEGTIRGTAQVDVNHVRTIHTLDNGGNPPVWDGLRQRIFPETFHKVVPELLREGRRNAPAQSFLNLWPQQFQGQLRCWSAEHRNSCTRFWFQQLHCRWQEVPNIHGGCVEHHDVGHGSGVMCEDDAIVGELFQCQRQCHGPGVARRTANNGPVEIVLSLGIQRAITGPEILQTHSCLAGSDLEKGLIANLGHPKSGPCLHCRSHVESNSKDVHLCHL
mmetsp:Transcript_59899/g.94865  ORF Transcript_59899/g.94865 Transcript_59899/m.94865 type:complete len:254 (+) Transcript_59899:533-1294(+)